jgi:hypothetical protein
MKSDTHLKSEKLFQKLLMQKSNEERLIMGCSMFGTAKEIVKSSIINDNPNISREHLKKEVFLRFYGKEVNNKHLFEYLVI